MDDLADLTGELPHLIAVAGREWGNCGPEKRGSKKAGNSQAGCLTGAERLALLSHVRHQNPERA